MTVMIITQKNKIFECAASDLDDALDQYINKALGFQMGFSMAEDKWQELTATIQDTSLKIALVNGLCVKNKDRISKLITGYYVDYTSENHINGVTYEIHR